MADYAPLIEAAIDRMTGTIGQKNAVDAANEIEGLSVGSDGSVESLSGDGVNVLGDLVQRYSDLGGPVAVSLIARAIKGAVDDLEDYDLPDALEERL